VGGNTHLDSVPSPYLGFLPDTDLTRGVMRDVRRVPDETKKLRTINS